MDKLPIDLVSNINEYLDINSKLSFSKTNKEINNYYKRHITMNIPKETLFYYHKHQNCNGLFCKSKIKIVNFLQVQGLYQTNYLDYFLFIVLIVLKFPIILLMSLICLLFLVCLIFFVKDFSFYLIYALMVSTLILHNVVFWLTKQCRC